MVIDLDFNMPICNRCKKPYEHPGNFCPHCGGSVFNEGYIPQSLPQNFEYPAYSTPIKKQRNVSGILVRSIAAILWVMLGFFVAIPIFIIFDYNIIVGIILCVFGIIPLAFILFASRGANELFWASVLGSTASVASAGLRSASDVHSHAKQVVNSQPSLSTSRSFYDSSGNLDVRINRYGNVTDRNGNTQYNIRNGNVTDRTGNTQYSIRNGFVMDRTGNTVGKMNADGTYYDTTGNYLGKVERDGSIFDRTGKYKGKIH